MADTRKRASMSQILSDITPYIKKKFMSSPYIHKNDIPVICQLLLSRYKNVTLQQGLMNSQPDFRIRVKGLLGTEEKIFEVVGGKRKITRKRDDCSWIDHIEEINAALDDF